MAFHARSNSLTSKSHPVIAKVEDHICRLKFSQEASVSGSSRCTHLASLTDLQEDISNLIQLQSVQQDLSNENSASELLDGSIKLVEICGVAREVVFLMKESVQELQSSLRRNRGIDAYINSRKNIDKLFKKCIKDLKSTFDQCSTTFLYKENNLNATGTMLKEAQAIGFSVLKSVLSVFESKQKTWPLVSKFTNSSRVESQREKESNTQELYALNIHKLLKEVDTFSVPNVMKKLKESEMAIQELEENLEAFFRGIVKTRVSLLNVLNN